MVIHIMPASNDNFPIPANDNFPIPFERTSVKALIQQAVANEAYASAKALLPLFD